MSWVICQGCGNVFDTEGTKTTAHSGCCPKCGLHYQGHYSVVKPILNPSPLAAKPIPERTCRMERAAYFPFWRCSECGAVNQGIQGKEAQEQPRYCPNCGAKVVE